MNLENATGFLASYSMGRLKDNRGCLVLVAKATFDIPSVPGDPIQLSEQQIPIQDADKSLGEPGLSATLYENDFAPYKPRCDVIMHASAYAPPRSQSSFVDVRMQVGAIDKRIRVIGNRQWQKRGQSYAPSPPELFAKKDIHYGCAYGGAGFSDADQQKPYGYPDNPVGVGYFEHSSSQHIVGQPLPNTEEINNPVREFLKRYRPMSFGPIGRNFARRYPLAGTYDQHWIDNISPLWPDDFNERYHQCAPEDQQISHLKGGEKVKLENVTPNGLVEFMLPTLDVPMMILNRDNQKEILPVALDTLILEPGRQRFAMVWRAHRPLKINIHEVDKAVVGKISPAWWRAIQTGKAWNPLHKKNPFEAEE